MMASPSTGLARTGVARALERDDPLQRRLDPPQSAHVVPRHGPPRLVPHPDHRRLLIDPGPQEPLVGRAPIVLYVLLGSPAAVVASSQCVHSVEYAIGRPLRWKRNGTSRRTRDRRRASSAIACGSWNTNTFPSPVFEVGSHACGTGSRRSIGHVSSSGSPGRQPDNRKKSAMSWSTGSSSCARIRSCSSGAIVSCRTLSTTEIVRNTGTAWSRPAFTACLHAAWNNAN